MRAGLAVWLEPVGSLPRAAGARPALLASPVAARVRLQVAPLAKVQVELLAQLGLGRATARAHS